MADNSWQAETMTDLASVLRHRYKKQGDVFVGIDLLVYYEEGNRAARLAPDVMVVLGVPAGRRMSYKIWEEGKPPDFVMEVASPRTSARDAADKLRTYERMGVREYWMYDPMGGLHEPRLQAHALVGDRYVRCMAVDRPEARLAIASEVLGLELRFDGERLRLWDVATKGYLRDPWEAEDALSRAQDEIRDLRSRLAEMERAARDAPSSD